MKKVHIEINQDTKKRLKSTKTGRTYDYFINELLDTYNEFKRLEGGY